VDGNSAHPSVAALLLLGLSVVADVESSDCFPEERTPAKEWPLPSFFSKDEADAKTQALRDDLGGGGDEN